MKKKILAISLVLAIALSALGVGYALWSDTLTIDGTINTGNVAVEWSLEDWGVDETKQVSSISPVINGKVLEITLNNAYPCVDYWVLADIHCTGSVPVHLQDIVFTGVPEGVTITMDPQSVAGTQLHYCESVYVMITIHLDNSVGQCESLTFSGSVQANQYNEP